MPNYDEEDFYFEEEWELMREQRRELCKEASLKIENGDLICKECSRRFIDKPNLLRINNFDGEKVAEKLTYYRTPHMTYYRNKSKFCDLYYKIHPNSNLGLNLNVLLEYFGNKTFVYLLEDFGSLDDLLDEDNVNIYLSVLLKALKKGSKAFNSYTIGALNKVLGRFLEFVRLKLERREDFSEQVDSIIKSILIFFLSLRNLDVNYIDGLIKTYFVHPHIVGLTHIDYLTEYAEEIDLYSHSLKHTNQEIKSFLMWLVKRITASVQKPKIRTVFKIDVLGPLNGGKSAICNYIANKTFVESPQEPKTVVDFLIKATSFTYQGLEFAPRLVERNSDKIGFSESSIYGNASGILLVFDLTNITHLNQVELALKELEKRKKVPILIAANKKDLEKHKDVSDAWIRSLKNKFNILDYVECSAKTGETVNALFQKLCVEIVKDWII